MTRRRIVLTSLGALAVVYMLVAISPLPEELGRTKPWAASLLSPPLLNFYGTYESGKVLDIEIGMTHDELRQSLVSNFREQYLSGPCGDGEDLPHAIPITGDKIVFGEGHEIEVENARAAFESAISKDVVCLSSIADPQIVLIYFSEDRVRKVEVNFLRVSK